MREWEGGVGVSTEWENNERDSLIARAIMGLG